MIRLVQPTFGLAAALALAALCLAARPAAAQGQQAPDKSAQCQVYEIKASSEGGGIDPALKPLERKLKKPPFSSWKAFELLKKHDRQVEQMKALGLSLVPGGKLSILYRDRTDAPGKKPRLRLSFTLDDATGKRVLDGTIKLDSGDYYLIGGDELEGGGTYILAVSCAVR